MTDGTVAPERMVSNGHLPGPDRVAVLVAEAWRRFRADGSGAPSTVYPALSAVDPALFGICVTAVTGQVHTVGDCDVPFTIMSVAKPFAFALVCEAIGADAVRDRIGVNATALPFNSAEAIERGGGRTNPMVNGGALATVALLGRDPARAWAVLDLFSSDASPLRRSVR